MSNELAFVLINPYTLAKSRTGGVIGRFLSRTGLELVAARMFAPSAELVREYAALVRSNIGELDEPVRELLADYVEKAYAPDTHTGRPRRVMLILLEGENAIQRVREATGNVTTVSGETVRDTFGDYVLDENGEVRYFEPAVLIGANRAETAAALKLWARYAKQDSGIVMQASDCSRDTPGWQRTLVLIKPDNFRFPNARPGNIIDVLSRSGLRIIAANVHRMSVEQAERFYRPVQAVLREKMKSQAATKAVSLLEKEFNIGIPPETAQLLAETLGPLLGDEQFYQLIKFMTGYYPPTCPAEERTRDGQCKCLALIYSGINAVEKIRGLLGSTDPNKAPTGSVRREFGRDIMVNAAHASDSPENAEREIEILNVGADNLTPWIAKYYP